MRSDTPSDSGPILTDPQKRNAHQLLEDAQSAHTAGQFPQAVALGYLALKAIRASEHPDLAAEARVHLLLSEVMDEFKYRALERIHANEAMRAWESSGNATRLPGSGPFLLRLGLVATNGGDLPIADYYLRQALAAFEAEQPSNRHSIVTTLLALAKLSLRRANLLHVLDRTGSARLGEAAAYLDRAVAVMNQSDHVDSSMRPILELQARLLIRGSSHLPGEHRDTAGKMLEQAESMLRLSLKQRAQATIEDPRGRLEVLNDLISVLRRTDRPAEAMEVVEQALAITDRLQRMDVDVVINMALVASDLSSLEMLLSLCDIVMNQEEAAVAEVSSKSGEALTLAFSAQSRYRSAICLSLLGESTAEDQAVAHRMLDLVLRRKAIVTDAEGVFWDTLYRQTDPDLEQARNHLTTLRNRLSTKVATGDFHGTWQLVAEIQRGDELLSVEPWWRDFRAGRGDSSEMEAVQEYAKKILAGNSSWDAIASIEQPLARDKIDVDAVVQTLPADAALVEFVRIEKFDHEHELFSGTASYWALLLHADGTVKAVDMGDAGRIEAGITARLEALRAADITDAGPQMAAMSGLYELVWAPIAGETGNAERVVVGTDGALALVPFSALVGPDGRFLIEQHVIYQVASGRDLIDQGHTTSKAGIPVVVADPDFDAVPGVVEGVTDRRRNVAITQPLRRLEATSKEGEKVKEALGGKVRFLTHVDATESRLRRVGSPKVLHLATHGVFDEASRSVDASELSEADAAALDAAYVSHVRMLSRSGLALAGVNVGGMDTDEDGLLTAFDVVGINLAGTELAVLSGCDTGLGNPSVGEGVLGLRRAFRIAGARYVIMSLWRLKDKEAERQMRAFYEAYVDGADPVLSLHQMQRERIEWFRKVLNGQAPPALWGAWTVQGAPGP